MAITHNVKGTHSYLTIKSGSTSKLPADVTTRGWTATVKLDEFDATSMDTTPPVGKQYDYGLQEVDGTVEFVHPDNAVLYIPDGTLFDGVFYADYTAAIGYQCAVKISQLEHTAKVGEQSVSVFSWKMSDPLGWRVYGT